MGVLHLLGGGLLLLAPSLIASGKDGVLSWVILGHMLCYMPTLALSNTVAFTNIDDDSDQKNNPPVQSFDNGKEKKK